MARKRMLVADPDAAEWDELGKTLGDSWIVVGAKSGDAALVEAQREHFDVVVANYDLPGPGAEELLNQIRAAHPGTLRFIAAKAALKEKVMCSATGGHQFLAVPFDRSALKTSIERSLAVDYGMTDNVRELVGRIRSFPTIPSIYLEVVNALKDPNATTEDIGAIIAKDMSMTTKLIQIINSAYFGLPRTITDPKEAVGILGFDTVKSMIMAVKLLSQYDKIKPVYFSIDQVWRHSTNVARTARVMALLETNDAECSSTAFTAGLLHDMGKIILAATFDREYHVCHDTARKKQLPLWEVEKKIFGATHGEMGAYLLARWGLSPEVVRVAALHEQPIPSDDKTFTALTAVHVANALDYEVHPNTEGLPAAQIDCQYLQQIGKADRVDLWRFARRDSDTSRFAKKVEPPTKPAPKPVEKIVTPPPLPAPKMKMPAAPATTPPAPVVWRNLWLWVGFGLAIFIALALGTAVAVKRIDSLAQNTAVNTNILTAIPLKAVANADAAPPAPATSPAPTAPVAPSPEPAKTGIEALKLQAIFYSSGHPTALINGKLVSVSQRVGDCRVISINPTSVTLEYQNQRKMVALK